MTTKKAKRKNSRKKKTPPIRKQKLYPPKTSVVKKSSVPLYKNIWSYVVTLSVILGLIVGIPEFKRIYLTTHHEKFIEEKYVHGILIPDLAWVNGEIYIDIGGGLLGVDKKKLIDGYEYHPGGMSLSGENPIKFTMMLSNDRLYFFCDFKDRDGNLVGMLRYNEWKLVKEKVIDYNSDDQRLEIIDKDNNVLSQFSFVSPNVIKIRGYYVSKEGTIVLGDSIMGFAKDDPNYEQNVNDAIKKLPRFFP